MVNKIKKLLLRGTSFAEKVGRAIYKIVSIIAVMAIAGMFITVMYQEATGLVPLKTLLAKDEPSATRAILAVVVGCIILFTSVWAWNRWKQFVCRLNKQKTDCLD